MMMIFWNNVIVFVENKNEAATSKNPGKIFGGLSYILCYTLKAGLPFKKSKKLLPRVYEFCKINFDTSVSFKSFQNWIFFA